MLSFVFFPSASFAHGGDEARVEIEPEVAATVSAGKIDYIFELVDNVQKIPLTDRDLNVEMTKLLHFIAYDEALAEFQHVHPAFKNGQWHVELNFSKSGTYWLWAQGQIKNGGVDFAASSQLTITGGQPANPTPPTLSDRRKGNDRNSVVSLSNDVIHAGKMAMLMLTYSRNDGSKPEITPYLGALAHIIPIHINT